MDFNTEIKDDIAVFTIHKLVSDYDNKTILEVVEEVIVEGHTDIIVDLKHLQFINSSGLSFLMSVLTRARNAGGDMYIINVSEQVSRLLVMTKLESLFTMFESEEEAKNAFIQ